MKMKGSTMETKGGLILLLSLNLISPLSAQTGSSFFYYYSPNQPMVVNSQTYGSNPQAHHNVIPTTSSITNPFNSNPSSTFQRQPSLNTYPTASPFVPQRSNYHQTYPQQQQAVPSYYGPSGPSILEKFGFTTAPSVIQSPSQNYYSPQQSFHNSPASVEQPQQQSQSPSGQPQPSAKLFNFLNQPFQFFQNNFDRFSSQSNQQLPQQVQQNQQNLAYRPVSPTQQPGQGFGEHSRQNQQYFYNYYNNAGARPTTAETSAPTTAEPESEDVNGIVGVGNPARSYYNRGTPGTYSVKQYFSSTGQSPTSYSFNIDSSPTTGPTATVQVNMGQSIPTNPENPSRPLRFIPPRFSNRVTVPVERRPEEPSSPSDDLPLEGVPVLEDGGQDLEVTPEEDIPLPQDDEYKSVTTEAAVVEVQMSTSTTTTTAAPPPTETSEEEEEVKAEVKSTETVPSTTASTTTTTTSEPPPETILTTTVITTTTTTTIKPVVVAKVDSERRTRKRILIRKKIPRKRIGLDQNGNKIPQPEEDISKNIERRPDFGDLSTRKPTPPQTTTQRPRQRTRKPGLLTTTSAPSTTTTPTTTTTTTSDAQPIEPITTESIPVTISSSSTEPPVVETHYDDLEEEKVPSSSTSINLRQEETTEPNILTTATTQTQPQFSTLTEDDSERVTATLAPLITTTNTAETTGAPLLDEESTTTSTPLNKQSHQSANPSSTEKSFSSYDGDDDYYEYYYDGETPSPKEYSTVSSTESSTQQNVFTTTPTSTTTTTGSTESGDEVSPKNIKTGNGGNGEDVDGDLQEISSTALPLEEEVIEPLSTTESPKATSSTEAFLEVEGLRSSTTQEPSGGQEGSSTEGSSTEGKGEEGSSTEGKGQEGSSTEGIGQEGSSTEGKGQENAGVTSQPPLGLTTEKVVKLEAIQPSGSDKVPEDEQEVVTKISTEVSGDLPDFDYGVVVEAEVGNETGQVSENDDKNSQDPAQAIAFPEEYFDPQEEYPINFQDEEQIIENQRQGLVNALINIRNRQNSSSTTTTPKADEDDSPNKKFVRKSTKVSAFPSASSSPTLDGNNYDDEEIGGDSRSKILQKIQTFKTKLRRVGGQRAISSDALANHIRSTTKRPRRVTRPSAGSSTTTTSSTELPLLSIAEGNVEDGVNEVNAEAALPSTTSGPKFRSSTTTTSTTYTTTATTTTTPISISQNQVEDGDDSPVPKADVIEPLESSTNAPKTKKRFRTSTSSPTTPTTTTPITTTTTATTSSALPEINEAINSNSDSITSSKTVGELIIREILPTTQPPVVIITTPQDDTLDEETNFDENTDFETGSAEDETSRIQVVTEVNFSISSSGNRTSENFKLSGFQNNSQLPNELSSSATFESTTLQTAESSTQRKVKVILKRRKGAPPGSGTVARQVVRTRTRVRPRTPPPA